MADSQEPRKTRVVMIGVGGASCSGKTTLAKHLLGILPNSLIVHQDDFAPPQEQVPIHPEYGIQDWDDAPGAIVWPKMAKELEYIKENGHVSDSHYSHDHLNVQKSIPVELQTLAFWKTRLGQLQKQFEEEGYEVKWVIVDGFLLYWFAGVYNLLDVKIFLRVPEPLLRKRRQERAGYHTAALLNPEGTLWTDPPNYWETVVYPAYVRAHAGLFEGDNLEGGALSGKISDLIVFDSQSLTMTELVDRACRRITNKVEVEYL